jgi:hypothetical protein
MSGFSRKEQILLLEAGLEEKEDESFKKFKIWADSQDFSKEFSHTEYRLVPFLWFRHRSVFKEHPIYDRFQGVYKRTLFHNSRLLKSGIDISQLLENASISHAFVKGLNFMLKVYPSWGTRPMNDMDLLVYEKDLVKASQVLERAGYVPKKPLKVVKLLNKNSIGFVSKEGIGVDLHIRPIAFPVSGFDGNYFLADKEVVETQLGGIPVMNIRKAVEFTILNGLLETDGHWLLDIHLADSKSRFVSDFLMKLRSSEQLQAMVAYRLKLFQKKDKITRGAEELPKAYIALLSNRMKDNPDKFRLLNFYWFMAMKRGRFSNPYLNFMYYLGYISYTLIWIVERVVGKRLYTEK